MQAPNAALQLAGGCRRLLAFTAPLAALLAAVVAAAAAV
jgi:hypothetical protein